MTQQIHHHEFDNGLVLVAEPMPWLESAAFTILVPAGAAADPLDRVGLGNFTCDMVQRGAGSRDSRQFLSALENLGVNYGSMVTASHTTFGGAMLADHLPAAIEIFADLLRRPHLPAEQLEETRLVCFQELRALEDDLSQKVLVGLRALQFADPWGRCPQGSWEAIESITVDEVRRHFETAYRPNGAILGVAGKLDWPQLRDRVEDLLGDWPRREPPPVEERQPTGAVRHIETESAQTHIGVAFPSVPYRDADYYQAQGAVGVLGDGSSSRLFTEVRERRGLCYTVFAMTQSLRDRAAVLSYAGTSNERAQETLDVMVQELVRLGEGIEQAELDRLKARIKTSLMMQQESSRSRSASVAADWHHLGRVRTLDELSDILDKLSAQSINAYLAAHKPGDFRIVTLGPEPLEAPRAVS